MVRSNPPAPAAFSAEARALGFCATAIFGTKVAIPSFVELIQYVPFYIERSQELAAEIGLSLNITHVDDGLFEQGHQIAKLGSFFTP